MPRVLHDEVVFPVLSDGEERPRGIIEVTKRVVEEDDGSSREQYIWKRGKFVIVVAVDPEGLLVFKREFKYAQMKELATFATVGIRRGESILEAARRGLRKELAMDTDDANVSILVSDLVNSPDKSTELHDIVLARDVESVPGLLAESGVIIAQRLPDIRPREFSIAIQRLALREALDYFLVERDR